MYFIEKIIIYKDKPVLKFTRACTIVCLYCTFGGVTVFSPDRVLHERHLDSGVWTLRADHPLLELFRDEVCASRFLGDSVRFFLLALLTPNTRLRFDPRKSNKKDTIYGCFTILDIRVLLQLSP